MMDRYCTNCGAELLSGAAFCTACGKPVSRASQEIQSLPAGLARNNDKIIRRALWAAAILVMCVLGVAGIDYVGGYLGMFLIAGAVIAMLPVPLYLALALWIDRYEKEPIKMLGWAFLWGGTVAIFFSGIINTEGGRAVTERLGAGAGEVYSYVISAPIVEETTKALALFILFFWKKDEFDNVIDGIIYAAMVGLGFAIVENFVYYGRALAEGGATGGLQSFVMRGVLSPFGHPIYTAMTGIGLGLSRRSNNTFVKFAAPLAGLMAAIMLHAFWNGVGFVLPGGSGLIFAFFVYMPFLVIAVLASAFIALGREGRVIRQYLTPELQSGLNTQQEYDTLGSVTGRLRSSFRALRAGFDSWRAYSRFAQTATELAFHCDRVSRGITSVDAAGREAAYVQLLRDLRGRRPRDEREGAYQ
jgi:RsiW-degrading membrane proteinase PrsW (M82 family)